MIWKKQPVGSKLADLQNNKAGKNAATQSAAGLMSAADKTKLDRIALSVSSLTECATLDAVKTYLSGVIATMNVHESRVVGIITRFTDSDFINGGYYEGNIYYISNNINGFYAGVLYSITNADFVNFSNNNGTWAFNSVSSKSSSALAAGITLFKYGSMRIINCTNGSGSISTDGLDIGETAVAAPSSAYCMYYDGSSNKEGILRVDGTKVYVRNTFGTNVSASYIQGQIVYYV